MSKLAGSKIIVITLLFLIWGSVSFAGNTEKKNNKPNILFIMTDQQHAGMMSCAGNKYLYTPALDALARDGIRFELAYSSNLDHKSDVARPNLVETSILLVPNTLPLRGL